MRNRVLAVITTMSTAMAIQAATPTAAHAGGYGCSGKLVGTWRVPMKDQLTGKTYYRSDIKLYYNSRTGWNCAVLAKRPGKPRYGERTPMVIEIYNTRWAEDRMKNNYDMEAGRFKYYAGPVNVYGKNLCVSMRALHGDYTGPKQGPSEEYNGHRTVSGVACH